MSSLTWNPPITYFQEISSIFRVIQKPNANQVFWATQVSFRNVAGAERAGVHFGLQTGSLKANATKTAVNWGGYDTIIGGGATLRGSIPTISGAGSDNASPLFAWYPDRDYLFRVFVSPKQNWTDAELTDEVGNVGGDQQAGEIAFRCTITDLSTGVETWIRDLLIPNCHTTAPMYNAVSWDEDFNTLGTVAYDVRYFGQRVNKILVPTVTGDVTAGLNTDIIVDRNGYRIQSGVTRTFVAGTTLTLLGPAVRSSSIASLGSPATAGTTLALATPANAVAGDLLIACVTNDRNNGAITAPAGWTLLGAEDFGADGPKQSIFYRRYDGSTTTQNFVQTGSNNYFSGVMLCMYRADAVAPPVGGVAGVSAGSTTAWSAPSMTKTANYGRLLVFLSAGQQASGFDATFAPNLMELADTSSLSALGGDGVTAVAQEAFLGPAGATPAYNGNFAGGTWRNVGRQVMVAPEMQRAVPTSTVSGGTWTTAPLWDKVDEVPPSDSDYITGQSGAVATLGLSSVASSGITDGNTVRYRCRRQNAATATLLVELMQGATVIASKTETVLGGNSFVDGAFSLTATEVGNITDFTALRVRLTATTT